MKIDYSIFVSSVDELKNLRHLAILSMLTALCVILGFFQLQLGDFMSISFGFLAVGMMGELFGPAAACLGAGVSDLLSYFLHPSGAFFPGFTLSACIGGIIYGFFLYKKRTLSFGRILLAMLTVGVFVNLFLNTLWLTILYGYGYIAMLPLRLLKECVTIPFNSLVFYLFNKPIVPVIKNLL